MKGAVVFGAGRDETAMCLILREQICGSKECVREAASYRMQYGTHLVNNRGACCKLGCSGDRMVWERSVKMFMNWF
jgi:hypothetical protein